MILIIDNYDSFTYNLVHLVAQSLDEGMAGLQVSRNDKISLGEIEELSPGGILISPGPGRPEDAGITCDIVREFGENVPILGVCLGHQAIGHVFGGSITYAPTLMHGKTSLISHDEEGLFKGVPQDFVATRYHSLVLSNEDLPSSLKTTATTSEGVVMGIRHRDFAIEGIQFHPESLLTIEGPRLIENWVNSLVSVSA